MKKTWDGLWVCLKDWEPCHPQDFVRGRKEQIAVPVSRPDQADVFNSTTLSANASKGDLTVDLTSVTDVEENSVIGITLDDDSVQWTFLTADAVGSTVMLNEALVGDAASGNTVYTPGGSFMSSLVDPATDL